jgi:hypothetical protein
MKITFRDGYSVMKQRFTYQGGYIAITAVYGDQKTLTRFEKSKEVARGECLVCFVMFGSFGALFLCETVTAMTYLDMLQIISQMWCSSKMVHPPHSAPILREFLDIHFPGRWVWRDGPITWPPRSPDITALDFFLWGYVKDIVYKTPVTSLAELKLRNIATIETPQMLENIWREIECRSDILLATKGTHVEVIQDSAVFIPQIIKPFELHFHIL